MRGLVGRAAADGVGHGLLLQGMIGLSCSLWAAEWTMEAHGLAALAAGVLSAALFAWLIRKMDSSRRIAGMSLLSAAFFLLTLAAGLAFAIECPVRPPMREMGNGDGILMMLLAGAYLLTAGALRGLVWLVQAERWRRDPMAENENSSQRP